MKKEGQQSSSKTIQDLKNEFKSPYKVFMECLLTERGK